jgi:hypothetical protein
MSRVKLVLGAFSMAAMASSAAANNVGENYAWQFPTTADKLNRALIQDIIEKKRGGYYSPPTYITNIDRQPGERPDNLGQRLDRDRQQQRVRYRRLEG